MGMPGFRPARARPAVQNVHFEIVLNTHSRKARFCVRATNIDGSSRVILGSNWRLDQQKAPDVANQIIFCRATCLADSQTHESEDITITVTNSDTPSGGDPKTLHVYDDDIPP